VLDRAGWEGNRPCDRHVAVGLGRDHLERLEKHSPAPRLTKHLGLDRRFARDFVDRPDGPKKVARFCETREVAGSGWPLENARA
jgi:hypothetical protein